MAPDGGLYVPEYIPRLELEPLRNLDYPSLVAHILGLYSDLEPACLERLARGAYGPDYGGPVAPLRADPWGHQLELFYGPTLSFKRQRRPVEQLELVPPGVGTQGCNRPPIVGAIGSPGQTLQTGGLQVGVQPQDVSDQRRIVKIAQRLQLEPGDVLGNIQSAVGSHSFQNRLGKGDPVATPASGTVSHGVAGFARNPRHPGESPTTRWNTLSCRCAGINKLCI